MEQIKQKLNTILREAKNGNWNLAEIHTAEVFETFKQLSQKSKNQFIKFCLVLDDELLRSLGSGLVFSKNLDEFYKLLNQAFFIERSFVEERSRFKQIIPYCVGTWWNYKTKKHYLLAYRRKPGHTEQRLAEKWSIGFGGHIEPNDLIKVQDLKDTRGMMLLFNAAEREFKEETGLELKLPHILGFLNLDEPGPVERVHFGVIIKTELNQDIIEDSKPMPKPKDGEIAEFKWLEFSDALDGIIPEYNWEAWSEIILKNWRKIFFNID